MDKRRFIEEHLPIREISEESTKEKSIRFGHPSTLHIWWARRPLSASRTTIYASLIPSSDDQKIIKNENFFIKQLSKWENSQNIDLLNTARKKISEFNKPLKILDPFSGGGSIPLESLRLGCETYATDYNPVSVILLKCLLEYPNKFNNLTNPNLFLKNQKDIKLIKDFTKWAQWVLEETKNELTQFFPTEYASSPIGYIWANVIECPNPSCKSQIPLMNQYWLVNTPRKKISLCPVIENQKIIFKILDMTKQKNIDFSPDKGTISHLVVNCPVCNTSISGVDLRSYFFNRKFNQKIIAVVYPSNNGKKYRLANQTDEIIYTKTKEFLVQKTSQLSLKWKFNPIPDELIEEKSVEQKRLIAYGKKTWSDLFNTRQLLVAISLVEKIRSAYEKMIESKFDPEYAKAITTYLAVCLDRLVDYNSTNTRWVARGEYVGNTFTRQAFPMVFDYFEVCPWSNYTGDWNSAMNWVIRVLENLSEIPENKVVVQQASATQLPYSDNYFDAIFTDPPYYDNINYAELSDFFYVWLKRCLREIYPELFVTNLVSKSQEIVANPKRHESKEAAKSFFESKLTQSFKEINRVLKQSGIVIIVYAHKSTEGWETLINSLLNSGLVVTAAWPINTEMKVRFAAKENAALASSIYMIAKKLEKEPIGFYRDVKNNLKNYLDKRLTSLWKEGISGADFFIAAIGSAIEVFGKYEKIVNDLDEQILVPKLLDDTREIVTNYAIKQVLHSDFSDKISQMTRFYILWRWAYGEAKVPFDSALRMAQSVGIDIEREWNKGFILKDNEFIRIVGPHERNNIPESSFDMIDMLHRILILWKKNKTNELTQILKETGYDRSDIFKRIAQAISESLPQESTEKKWLDGFLTRFRTDYSQTGTQSTLF